MKTPKFFLALSFLFLFSSAAFSMGCTVQENLISLTVGRVTTIEIAANHTTGYSWQLAEPLNEKVLKVEYWYYKQPNTKMLGAGGTEVWTFRAMGEGKTNLKFEYVRPWEKNVPAIKIKEYLVEVKK